MAIDAELDLDARVARAEDMYAAGDAEGARNLLLTVVDDPAATAAQRVQSLGDLGVIMASGGRLEEAEAHLLGALAQDPSHAPALESLSVVRETAGDLVQATHWAMRAAEAEPEIAGGWRRLAALLRGRRRFGQAREALEHARSLGDDITAELQTIELQRGHALRSAPSASLRSDCAAPTPVRRVLILVDFFHPSLGGSERLAEAVGVALIARGVAVDVATRALPHRSVREHRGIRIHEIFGDPIGSLQALLADGGHDAILIFSAPGVWPLEAGLRLPAPRPRVVAVPCINAENAAALRRDPVALATFAQLLATADVAAYSSLSGEDVRLFEELGLRGVYVPNASERLPDAVATPATEAPLLLMVANIWPEKNHLGLLRALREHPGDWRLQIIGDASPEYPSLAEEVRRLASEDPRAELLGPRGPQEVAAAMRAAKVLLLPSNAEATPLVLLEAMSAGLPWIATPSCGAAHDHAGGLILPLASFGEGIDFLLADELRARRLGDAGLAHWRSCYTWDVIGPRYAALLRGEPVGPLAAPPRPLLETDAIRAELYDRRPFAARVAPPSPAATSDSAAVASPDREARRTRPRLPVRPAPQAPRVAVVIPCYEQAQFLPEAVQSACAQTFDDLEIVIVDDGSPDDTALVARRLAERHSDRAVRLLRQENQGLPASRNNAIESTGAELILPLDADDMLDPRFVEACVAALDRHRERSIAYGDFQEFGARDRFVSRPEYDFVSLTSVNGIGVASMFRRRAWEEVGGYNERLCSKYGASYEDWDFWISCGERGHFGVHVPEAVFHYRVRPGSMSATADEQRCKAHLVGCHPALYSPEQLRWAEGVLAGEPWALGITGPTDQIPPLGTPPARQVRSGGAVAGARSLAVLALAGELLRDPGLLVAFADELAGVDDASLVACGTGAEIERLGALLSELGIDGEDDLDVLGVPVVDPDAAVRDAACMVDALLGGGTIVLPVALPRLIEATVGRARSLGAERRAAPALS